MIVAVSALVTLAEVPNPVDTVVDTVGGLAGRGASSIAGETLSLLGAAVMRGLGDACARVVEGVLSFLDASSGINLESGWWVGDRARAVLGSVFALSGTLMLGFCLLALVQGLLAGDPGAMLRAVLREVPVSVAATAALFGITGLLLQLTDAASAMVLQGTPGDLGHFLSGLGSAQVASAYGLLGGVVLAVFLLGGLLVWVELLVRSSLLYLLLAFAPLTLAARVWPAARGAFRRLCELGLALVVSKFAIALALALGAVALAGGGPRGEAGAVESAGMSLAGLLGGASLMALAAFTPFVVLRLLPVLEAAVVAQGVSRSPVRAAQGAAQGAYYAQGLQRLAAAPTAARVSRASASGGSAHGPSGPGSGPAPGGGGSPRPRPNPTPSASPAAPTNGATPDPSTVRPASLPLGVRAAGYGGRVSGTTRRPR